ncbi:DUF932 domain-containing protein [bacterium]|nr:DUF932 domain-containing protein [bacterium]
MVANNTNNKFDYVYMPINELRVDSTEDPKTGKKTVNSVLVKDEPIEPTDRFWTSLFARYSFNKSFFKYFDYQETFDRISEVEGNDRMRMCIQRNTDDNGKQTNKLLAVSNPNKPIVVHDALMELVGGYGGESINYDNGIVESTHVPRSGANTFDILGDAHENRFVMQTPIDGYGSPNIYLSLLRQVCSNGMIAMSKAFKSTLALGTGSDNTMPSIMRALEGFSNDEGFAAIRQRIESAGQSWLSVYEMQSLYKLLIKTHVEKSVNINDNRVVKGTNIMDYLSQSGTDRWMGEDDKHVGSPIIKAFHRMSGDPAMHYGLANLDGLSNKRQRSLPVKCTVYDAMNFATEVATHYAEPNAARKLQAWVGSTVSEEYDMEGTKEEFGDFADFLIDSKVAAGATGSEFSGAGAALLN